MFIKHFLNSLMMIAWLKKAYDNRWGDLHFIRRREWNWVSKWLSPEKEDSILDVACGDGFFSRKLGLKVKRIRGIDISEISIQKANGKNKHKNSVFEQADAQKLPYPDASFTKVFSICALQHIKNDGKALSEMQRVLKPKGILVITVDSIGSFAKNTKFIEAHARQEHMTHQYDKEGLNKKLEQARFTVLKSKYLLNAQASYFFVRLWSQLQFTPWLSLAFPIIYPLTVICDSMANQNKGCVLVIKAIKNG